MCPEEPEWTASASDRTVARGRSVLVVLLLGLAHDRVVHLPVEEDAEPLTAPAGDAPVNDVRNLPDPVDDGGRLRVTAVLPSASGELAHEDSLLLLDRGQGGCRCRMLLFFLSGRERE